MGANAVALLTGLIGLIGALGGAAIGGRAAMRGARISVDAAATAEHAQWVRGQRQMLYQAVLDAYNEFAAEAQAVHEGLDDQIDGVSPVDLSSEVVEVNSACSRVGFLGPGEVTAAANAFRRNTWSAAAALTAWEQAATGPTDELSELDREACRMEASGTKDAVRESYERFMAAAQAVLLHLPGSPMGTPPM
ncbi:hypothetical protein [Streptomyces sp. NPDC059271]|uniref:hypothetical protein n=1 Tax=unclassified Streptomyces TaxID=2593676 RepID=UPI003657198B